MIYEMFVSKKVINVTSLWCF